MKTTFRSPAGNKPRDKSGKERFMDEIREIMGRMYRESVRESRRRALLIKRQSGAHSPSSISQADPKKVRSIAK